MPTATSIFRSSWSCRWARPSFAEALRWGVEIFHTLKGVLKKSGYNTAVGDEGGFAPSSSRTTKPSKLVLEAITQAGYKPGEQIAIALDPAASEFYDKDKKKYVFKKSDKSEHSSAEMVKFWADWVRQYPIVSIEDGLAEDDWDGWKMLTDEAGQQDPAGRRRSVRHQRRAPAARHRRRRRQFDPDQGQPDRHADRDDRRHRAGARSAATPRSSRTARAKPKTPSSPTSPSPPERARSRPARPAAPTASPSTTSCCASKRNSAAAVRGLKALRHQAFRRSKAKADASEAASHPDHSRRLGLLPAVEGNAIAPPASPTYDTLLREFPNTLIHTPDLPSDCPTGRWATAKSAT